MESERHRSVSPSRTTSITLDRDYLLPGKQSTLKRLLHFKEVVQREVLEVPPLPEMPVVSQEPLSLSRKRERSEGIKGMCPVESSEKLASACVAEGVLECSVGCALSEHPVDHVLECPVDHSLSEHPVDHSLSEHPVDPIQSEPSMDYTPSEPPIDHTPPSPPTQLATEQTPPTKDTTEQPTNHSIPLPSLPVPLSPLHFNPPLDTIESESESSDTIVSDDDTTSTDKPRSWFSWLKAILQPFSSLLCRVY